MMLDKSHNGHELAEWGAMNQKKPHKKALIIGCYHTKTLQHLIENHVVTINRPISSTFYNRTRIPIVLSISVYQPFEFLNF